MNWDTIKGNWKQYKGKIKTFNTTPLFFVSVRSVPSSSPDFRCP